MMAESISLNELDIKPVFYIKAKNIFYLNKTFIFYDTHFEYNGLSGKTKKTIYSDVRNVRFWKNSIHIYIYSKKIPVVVFGVDDPEELAVKLGKPMGVAG